MKNAIGSNLRQSVVTWRFLLGVLFVAAAVFLASTETLLKALRSEDLLDCGFHGSFVLNAARSDTIVFCLPIVCALPFAASFVDDVNNGFLKLYIHRAGRQGYILGRSLGCVVSGGLVVALGLLLAYGAAALVFLPMEAAPLPDAENPGYFREILSVCWRFFLSGGLWALAGLTLSSLMESRYIAYGAPFILYYILIILYERYFDRLYVLYPKAWLFPGAEWVWGQWSAALLLLALMALLTLIFGYAVRKRVSEL